MQRHRASGELMAIGGLAAAIDHSLWEKLTKAGRRRSYRRGEVLMTEGDPVRYVGALLQGRVKVSRVDVDGNTTVFAVRGPGELLGEIGVLSRDRRSATVTAIDRCELSII